jgi:hypothetical protein
MNIDEIMDKIGHQANHLVMTYAGSELEWKMVQLAYEWYLKGQNQAMRECVENMENSINDGRATISNQES